MDEDETGRYGWLAESVIAEAGCITLVDGADLDVVAWAMGGDLDRANTMELADIAAMFDTTPTAALRSFGAWALVVEENGFQGSRPEVLRRLSSTGRAVSACWDVNARAAFSYAVEGSVLTAFEAMRAGCRSGSEPDHLEQLRAGLPWEDPDATPQGLMLALLARVTGFALGPRALTGLFTVVPLLPWPTDVP